MFKIIECDGHTADQINYLVFMLQFTSIHLRTKITVNAQTVNTVMIWCTRIMNRHFERELTL